MRVHVVAFAALRDALGASRITLNVESGQTAGDLQRTLAESHPRWRELILGCRMAVGVEFVDASYPLASDSELVFIPPVSGGSEPPSVRLTRDRLQADALEAAAHEAGAGAVVVFVGTVRSPSLGKDVQYLDYEAYEAMAVAQMERIVTACGEQWPIRRAYLHHRLGRVEVGEASVVAVASTPHRGQAFEACRFLIEQLKHEVPIWKKEVFTDGSEWVGAPGECRHDAPSSEQSGD